VAEPSHNAVFERSETVDLALRLVGTRIPTIRFEIALKAPGEG
jgi:hypothetical protein